MANSIGLRGIEIVSIAAAAVLILLHSHVSQDTSAVDFDDQNVDISHKDEEQGTQASDADAARAGMPLRADANQPPVETRSCYFGWIGPLNLQPCEATELWSQAMNCDSDQTLVMPYGIREISEDPAAERAPWKSVGMPHCADPAQPETLELHEVVEQEFATLPIAPSALSIQPMNGWTLVNVPTIVYTDNNPQQLSTTLLGTTIDVEVTPVSFTWDFDDPHNPGALTTEDPGLPYPDHNIDHTYTHTGDANIALTTTWTGRFRTEGSATWTDISGTATTTTTGPNLEIREATSRLVEDPQN